MVCETHILIVCAEVAVCLDLNRSVRVVDVDDLVYYLTLLSVLADDVEVWVCTCSVAYHERLGAICRVLAVPLELYPWVNCNEVAVENAPEVSLEVVAGVAAVGVTHDDDRTLVATDAVHVLSELLELSVLSVDVA